MGSLFGGAQTVPTTQNTFQNQTGTSYASNVSNPFATNVGEQATAFADIIGARGAQDVPLLNVLAPTAGVTQATNQLGQNASTINPLMGTAVNNINQAGGYFPQASGFIGSGAGLAQQAGQAITPNDINSFLNPFTSNVTANLQDIFGQQNAQNLLGSTQAAGGAGSERSAVGQALLAQRQQLTAGNIYADLYQRSLQAAEQQKAQQLAAGQGLIGAGGATGALGSQLGQLGLGTAGAVNQTNALNLQGQYQYQNLLQQQQNALYQQQLGQYEDPFRRLAATSGAIYPMIGLGGAQTAGQNIGSAGFGTSATTFPAPPLGPQLAGLGLAGAALFAARGGRIKKKHKFDLGGAVDGGMSSPLGTEDMGDSSAIGGGGGEAAPMGLVGEGAPSGGTGSFGGQSDTEASPATMTTQQGQPISEQKAISSSSPEEKTLGKRNQYALMQALLKQSIGKQQQQMQAPRISWPQPLTMKQEGGRVSKFDTTTTNKFSPQAYLNPKDEETESAAHFRLTPNWGMSRRGNPYFNTGDKNNLYSDMRDPGMGYPMLSGSRYPISPPPSGQAPGLYADGGMVGGDDEDKFGGEAAPLGGAPSPMVQAALSDDDDEDEVGGEAAPLGGAARPAAQVNQVLSPYDTGVNPSVGAPGPNAGGMSPGKLALLQAGLGMMAAAGQRDRHGLPMAPLAAIGQGGMQGVNTYQQQQVLAQRERAAQATLGLKAAQLQALEEHRRVLESRPFVAGKDEWGEPIYAVHGPNGTLLDPMKRTPLGQVSEPVTENETKQRGRDVAAGIANYNLPPLSPFRMQTPAGRKLMEMVLKENPDYDARFYNESNRAKTAFGTGTQGDTVRRFNTFIAHSHTLERAMEALKNKDYPLLNQMRLAWKRQTGSELPTNFEAIRDIYGNEAVAATVGTRNALGDRQEVRHQIATSNSPEQTLGIIEQHRELAGGQLRSLKQQYETSTRSKDFEDKLLPESKHALSRVKSYAGTPEAEVSTKEMEREKSDAQKWIKDNPDADPKKIERIKKHYGLE